MPLDVPTAIAQRRSIKTFKPDAIAPELLKQLVELTVAAPSSYNIQGWRIILVQDTVQKAALAEAAWGQAQISNSKFRTNLRHSSRSAPLYEA